MQPETIQEVFHLVLADPGLVAEDHTAHGVQGSSTQPVNGNEVRVQD